VSTVKKALSLKKKRKCKV